jgi:RNA polymerase sigma-70 factor (ECF subfamily)
LPFRPSCNSDRGFTEGRALSRGMSLLSLRRATAIAEDARPDKAPCRQARPTFDAVYEENFGFIWRAARRLGIDISDTDDVVQEVFVIAHRRLPEFEGRAQVRTWLFKILVRVVRHYFRSQQRKPGHRPATSGSELESLRDPRGHGPAEAVERADAVRVLDGLLARLDADKREVFVLAEIEELSSVEIAEILGANLNTIYSRLRAARQEFARAVARFRTQELGASHERS